MENQNSTSKKTWQEPELSTFKLNSGNTTSTTENFAAAAQS